MNLKLEHKIVEHLLFVQTLLKETIDDCDGADELCSREKAAVNRGEEILLQLKLQQEQLSQPVETTHATTRDQRPQAPAKAEGGDGQ